MMTLNFIAKLLDIKVHVGGNRKEVILEFPGLLMHQLVMTPAAARELADDLNHYADEAERGSK